MDALEVIITANLEQDSLRNQVGHDHFHYDSNSFVAADAYCTEMRHKTLAAIRRADVTTALQAFGRLTHTVQDFYAHSNYVDLWRDEYPEAAPQEINPQDQDILAHSGLRSGKLYYPFEALSFIGILKPLVVPLLPTDSHARMNIDDPSRQNFDYAFFAAVKRTAAEYQGIVSNLSISEIVLFRRKGL